MFCVRRGSLPLKGLGAYRVFCGVGGAYRKEQIQVTRVTFSIGMAIRARRGLPIETSG